MSIIEKISDALCVDKNALLIFSSTAPYRYKVYEIPKRSGHGTRVIAHPAKQLKFIQRLIIKEISNLVSIHDCAYAYKKDISIKDNALVHKDNRYLLKMDFKNFFPSITPELLFHEFSNAGVSFKIDEKEFLSKMLFYKPTRKSTLRLSIGAPSSPFISNFIMYRFDSIISNYCKSNNIKYTRYADDITFSTNIKNALFSIPKMVSKILTENNYNLRINSEKTVYTSRAHNIHVTGITITPEGKLSTGRENKRKLQAMLHRFIQSKLTDKETEQLKGYLAFAFFIEPDFRDRLINKYGIEYCCKIFKCGG